MGKVKRIYVEKRKGYDITAQNLKKDILENLGISEVEDVRILRRYDVEGIDDPVFEDALFTVFADFGSDAVSENLPCFSGKSFTVEYLPGQYDQQADFCRQALFLMTQKSIPLVRTAKTYIFTGNISDKQLSSIKDYIINPVESRIAHDELPKTLTEKYVEPDDVEVLHGFTSFDEKGLISFIGKHSLAMDIADITLLQAYFRDEEKRQPTITELRILDTYWSDHCRHTTFLTHITDTDIEDDTVNRAYQKYLKCREMLGRGGDKPICLMDIATIGAKVLSAKGQLSSLDISEEINACSVRIKADENGAPRDWILMFKNETHNHPTEIEPFGGASTCLGGAIRDPLSGRSYAYQAMRITGCADPTAPFSDTIPGKLWQRKITATAADGYSSYGNQIGISSGFLQEIYHPGYMAKRMEAGAIVAAAPAENIVRETPLPGDFVLLIGGRTGRDGCGGATGSSKPHTEDSLEKSGAEVQKGNASEERKIQRLFRRPEASRLIKRCNDFGAGGVSVAIGELADGLDIDLDKVPVKYGGLDGTELAISESQERMAVVISPENKDKFIEFALSENLEASAVARVTENPRLVMRFRGKVIVDISRKFLNSNGAVKTTTVRVPKALPFSPSLPKGDSPVSRLINHISSLNICSQKSLADRFDSTAGGASLLMPYGGQYKMTPAQCMAAKLPMIDKDTVTCTFMSYGFSPEVSEKSPFHGAADAVLESVAKLVASGCPLDNIWLSFQEYFERAKGMPERWGKPFAALLGGLSSQLGLGIGAIGGKDSMSGSFEELDVPPTLISFAVGVGSTKHIISPEFKGAGNRIELFRPRKNDDKTPDFESLRNLFLKIHTLISEGKILSCWALGTGGIAEAAVKMSFGNGIGFVLTCSEDMLYDYICGGFLVECKNNAGGELIGNTTENPMFEANGIQISLSALEKEWNSTLKKVFSPSVTAPCQSAQTFSYSKQSHGTPATTVKRPQIFIPLLQGTTCEYDIIRCFKSAGGSCETLVIKNLSPEYLEASVDKAAEIINKSHILYIPDGLIPGDGPSGYGRFAAVFFSIPKIKDAVTNLIENRDGLVLGIGAGFNTLLKLGLLPYGEYKHPFENKLFLAENLTGRHHSSIVTTRISSVKSPWFAGLNEGQLFALPFSHGKGRFMADSGSIQQLAENGQIAAQFTDLNGVPSMVLEHNPSGSIEAIEAITSPDGRILGKLAHSERAANSLLINIPGDKSQNIFRAGVNYFK